MTKQIKPIEYRSIPNKANLFAQVLQLVFFIIGIVFLTYKCYYYEVHRNNILVLISILGLVLYFMFNYIRRKNTEPSFVILKSEKIILRNFLFYKVLELNVDEFLGFSSIIRKWYNDNGTLSRYNSYCLYKNDTSKYLLTQFNFDDFLELRRQLKKFGLKYLGEEDKSWSGKKSNYKFG